MLLTWVNHPHISFPNSSKLKLFNKTSNYKVAQGCSTKTVLLN
jgi:hypothetical protein